MAKLGFILYVSAKAFLPPLHHQGAPPWQQRWHSFLQDLSAGWDIITFLECLSSSRFGSHESRILFSLLPRILVFHFQLHLPQECFYVRPGDPPWAITSILRWQLWLCAVDCEFQTPSLDLELPTWDFPRVPQTQPISNWTQSFPQTYCCSSSWWLISWVMLATKAWIKYWVWQKVLDETCIWMGRCGKADCPLQRGQTSSSLWGPE